jgi:hypothetical protein
MNSTVVWIIWSVEHRAWWRENRHGYTKIIENAGVYSFKEAMEIVMDANMCGKINEMMCPR